MSFAYILLLPCQSTIFFQLGELTAFKSPNSHESSTCRCFESNRFTGVLSLSALAYAQAAFIFGHGLETKSDLHSLAQIRH
jgi:hypothetical protein